MKTYENHKYVQFSDVLDAITLFYIIKMEVREEMEGENGVEFLSDDEVDDNDEGGSDDYGEEDEDEEGSESGSGDESGDISEESSDSSSSSN